MPVILNVSGSVDRATALLNDVQREQIPFATARALTRTAYRLKADEVPASMRQEMQAPQRYTLGGARYDRATKANLRAKVFIENGRVKYLNHPAEGTARTPKTFPYVMVPVGLERASGRGRVLSPSLARAYRTRLLADSRRYFEAKRGNVFGIWRRNQLPGEPRQTPELNLVVLYLPATRYQKTWHFHTAMQKRALAIFPIEFSNSLSNALATARGRG